MCASQKFSTDLQLSEYVQAACRITNGTCLKSVSKSLRCNGSSNMIYLKDLKENKRFMDIGPTMAKWHGGVGVNFFSKFSQNRF